MESKYRPQGTPGSGRCDDTSTGWRRPRRRAWRCRPVLWLVPVAAALVAQAGEPERPDPWRESMRTVMDRWLETERVFSRERADWHVAREILADRTAVLTHDVAVLQDGTRQLSEDHAAQDTRRMELVGRQQELKGLSDRTTARLEALEVRALALVERAPGPLQERVRPLSQRIPRDPAEARSGLGERYQNVVGILNEMNKFARDVTVVSEVMPKADGRQVEASVIYFGFGQAFYVNTAGTVAGLGVAGPRGWEWREDNRLARDVADLIAMHRNEKPAQYVVLPVAAGSSQGRP